MVLILQKNPRWEMVGQAPLGPFPLQSFQALNSLLFDVTGESRTTAEAATIKKSKEMCASQALYFNSKSINVHLFGNLVTKGQGPPLDVV